MLDNKSLSCLPAGSYSKQNKRVLVGASPVSLRSAGGLDHHL
jgi:hypothetical protein